MTSAVSELQPEELGAYARGVVRYPHVLVPNPAGKSWNVLQWYYKKYEGPTWLYAISLSTGEVKKYRFPDKRQIHLAGQTPAFDGKYYIVTVDWGRWEQGGGGMDMYVYDPATNDFEIRGRIVDNLTGERRDLVCAPNGKLYGAGSYLDSRRVGFYGFDPETRAVRDYGPLGPSHAPHGCWATSTGVDDTHGYLVSGMIPWYLIAVDLETGKETVLSEAEPGDGRMQITAMPGGARVTIQRSDDAPHEEFWLYHGALLPKTGDTPPWRPQRSPWDNAPPRPEVYDGQLEPDKQGNAWLWFRLPDAARAAANPSPAAGPEESGWQRIQLTGIETYPLRIHRLAVLSDGRIFGASQGYLGRFLFDPKTGEGATLGRNAGLSPYVLILHEGRLYESGYWAGPIFVYDPRRPWTLYKGGPPGHPAPAQDSPDSNPRRIGNFHKASRVTKVFSAARGADGKLYFGGIGQRNYEGGGLAWIDPRTEEIGGLWRPFSGYAIHWIAPALEGRLLVVSTRAVPDELNHSITPESAKLFVYDVMEGAIIRDITVAERAPRLWCERARKTGPLLEVAPGRMLGITHDPEQPGSGPRNEGGGGLLYLVDVTTGELLLRKSLPDALGFEWGQGTTQWDFQMGPDGHIWTYLGETLVRIDPQDGSVHTVGRLSPRGKFVFVGDDMYLGGALSLRVLRDIVPNWKPK